jgi:hypothetical protein
MREKIPYRAVHILLYYIQLRESYVTVMLTERERESYATVSREVQNIFVLHVVSPIFKFKTPI